MKFVKISGLVLFIISFALFVGSLSMSNYVLNDSALQKFIVEDYNQPYHYPFVKENVSFMKGKEYTSMFSFFADFDKGMRGAQAQVLDDVTNNLKLTTSDGEYWNKVLKDDEIDKAKYNVAKASSKGFLLQNRGLIFVLTFILGIVGALMYILPRIQDIPGIKNNGIYHSIMHARGGLGIATGVFLILFYIVLYWFPHYITNWVLLVDPISQFMSGNPASQWFLYGFLYCIAVAVMGVRMILKYLHNRYQIVRTISVIFFQLAIAFTLPQILTRFRLPAPDLKNMWPLDYSFFFDYRLNEMIEAGSIGIFMLVWGIVLFVVGVPLITYFYGKRWYCSWVCGCGGLAETLGDPFRQLSDKSLNAWKIERYLIHAVLVFAIVMTGAVLYTYFTGSYQILFISSEQLKGWYGFGIGAAFAGVIGTGFYPLMGNRVWCRFGCPLAAYLGLVQKFKSRFRITVNGGQCISCGNCSTYCEMGIDVRSYAQRGQDIVRSSCVGCGVCSAVCPRGVLKLENSGEDIDERTTQLRTLHITEENITMLQ